MVAVQEYKQSIVETLVKDFQAANSLCVVELKGVRANELVKIRRELKGRNGAFLVVKGSLAKIALERSNRGEMLELIKGTIGMGIVTADPVASLKSMVDFAKAHDTFVIKGASIEGRLVGPNEITAIAALPPREVLLARLLSNLQAPVRNLAFVLNENLRKLVCILKEISDKKVK